MAVKESDLQQELKDELHRNKKGLRKFFHEFKEFAMRGNAIDLAVGLIVGAAFKDIIRSFVDDVVMPPFSLLTKKVNFEDLYINLSGDEFENLSAAEKAGAPVIKYGSFINGIVEFIIVAFVIFLMVRWINKKQKEKESTEEKPKKLEKKCPFCYTKIHIKATRCPNCTSKLDREGKLSK